MPTSRPTILQIIPNLDTGGAERTSVEIADAIVTAGGRALVLAEGGRLVADIERVGGEFVTFPAATKNPLRMLANAAALTRTIRHERVDLIHARSRAPAWSALLAARRAKIPFVTTYHGSYREKGRAKRLYNSIMARGDLVIANSNFTARSIMMRYGTPEARIRVAHRGVDGAVFDPAAIAQERVEALREAWGVAPHERVILQAARLTRWKGQSVVIEAARLLNHEAPEAAREAVVILAGDAQGRDDYREALRQQIAAAGLDGKVRLVGHVADMPAAYAASWIAVVASTEPEAFGRTATEAQVIGCPVIATDHGAPPETVRDPRRGGREHMTGWLVPAGDAPALADALAEGLRLTADERRRIGETARRHVIENFSLAQMCTKTLAVYDELLGTRLAATYASHKD